MPTIGIVELAIMGVIFLLMAGALVSAALLVYIAARSAMRDSSRNRN